MEVRCCLLVAAVLLCSSRLIFCVNLDGSCRVNSQCTVSDSICGNGICQCKEDFVKVTANLCVREGEFCDSFRMLLLEDFLLIA